MSGHSKWATIKHKKAATDAKRGQLFTKLIKEITVAARSSGNAETNPRLRVAVQRAKEVNMPADNIDRAIKKGTGELPGVTYEEITYEGYGPGGVAIIIEVLTDNKNRASSEIRNLLAKKGGNLAGAGSVSWIFEKKGLITILKNATSEDKLMSIALDAGAEDMTVEDEVYEIKTQPNDLDKVKKAISDNKITIESSEITMLPKTTVALTGEAAKQVLQLVESLEEHDDVQNVYANFDIPDEIAKDV